MRRLCLAAVAAAAFSACSSAPKPPDAIYLRRNEAVRLVALGARAVREGSLPEAIPFYEEAYRIATSVADDDNRLAALDGLAIAYSRFEPQAKTGPEGAVWAGAPASVAECLDLAREIAELSGRADLSAFVSVGEAEAALRSGGEAASLKAAELAAAAADALGKRPDDRSRALRALAEARKNLGDSSGALSALSSAASIDARAKRFAEYASDRYLAASVHSKLENYPAAREALLEALDADRRAEHSAGIGADYRALGLVEEKAGDAAAAARYFRQARDVFAAAKFTIDAADAEKRRAALEP